MLNFKNRCTPPGTQKHKGSIALWLLAALLVVSILSVSLATMAQATLSTGSSSKIALQAQQYAEAEAALVRATAYNEITAHERITIDNSLYESERLISTETQTADNIKQKTVSILIYRVNENVPRYTLRIPISEISSGSAIFKEWKKIPSTGTIESDGIIVITSAWNSVVYIQTSGVQRTFAHGRSKYGVGQTSMTCPIKKGEKYTISGAADIWFLKM